MVESRLNEHELGRPVMFSASATSTGAGSVDIPIRSSSKQKLLVVCGGWAWQQSGAQRSSWWYFYDGVTYASIRSFTSNTGVRDYFPRAAGIPTWDTLFASFYGPVMVARYDRYPLYRWSALGAGEVGYCQAICLEIDLKLAAT